MHRHSTHFLPPTATARISELLGSSCLTGTSDCRGGRCSPSSIATRSFLDWWPLFSPDLMAALQPWLGSAQAITIFSVCRPLVTTNVSATLVDSVASGTSGLGGPQAPSTKLDTDLIETPASPRLWPLYTPIHYFVHFSQVIFKRSCPATKSTGWHSPRGPRLSWETQWMLELWFPLALLGLSMRAEGRGLFRGLGKLFGISHTLAKGTAFVPNLVI